MNTPSKLTLHLLPEEVKQAVERYVQSTRGAEVQDGDVAVYFQGECVFDSLGGSYTNFTGATVEVTP